VNTIRSFLKNNRGQGMVEFALLLPILITLCFGMIEFGRVINEMLVVSAAAREGARYAAVNRTQSDSVIVTQVKKHTTAIDQGSVTVAITWSDPTDKSPGSDVTVTVSNPVAILTPAISKLGPNTFTVKGSVLMRVE
jgi:Flp pilus assembly protein TadG